MISSIMYDRAWISHWIAVIDTVCSWLVNNADSQWDSEIAIPFVLFWKLVSGALLMAYSFTSSQNPFWLF